MALQYQESDVLAEGHTKGITKVEFSPSGRLLATAGLDGRVCIWDVGTAEMLYVFVGTSGVLSLLWLPGGDELLICGLADGNIACLDIAGDYIDANGFFAHQQPVECLAVQDDYLISGACEEVVIWKWDANASNYVVHCELDGPRKTAHNEWHEILVTSIHCVSPSNGQRLIVVTYMNHGVFLIDATTWVPLRNFGPLDGPIASASISDDGLRIAVANVAGGISIYSLGTGAPLCSLRQEARRAIPTPVLWIHGGLALLGGSTAGQLTLWDLDELANGQLRKGDPGRPKVRVLYRLPLPEQATSIAIAAHYNREQDKFSIAAGIMEVDGPSPCILWTAKETARQLPGRPPLRRLLWLSWTFSFICMAALAYVWYALLEIEK